MTLTIGVLALQGAVEEHMMCLQKLGCKTKEVGKASILSISYALLLIQNFWADKSQRRHGWLAWDYLSWWGKLHENLNYISLLPNLGTAVYLGKYGNGHSGRKRWFIFCIKGLGSKWSSSKY